VVVIRDLPARVGSHDASDGLPAVPVYVERHVSEAFRSQLVDVTTRLTGKPFDPEAQFTFTIGAWRFSRLYGETVIYQLAGLITRHPDGTIEIPE
jgi:hypothetical protein